MKSKKTEETTNKLIKYINEARLNNKELVLVLANLLFSVGASIDEVNPSISSKEVMIKHSTKPTLGNALMAQALWFRDVWTIDTEREDDGVSGKSKKE